MPITKKIQEFTNYWNEYILMFNKCYGAPCSETFSVVGAKKTQMQLLSVHGICDNTEIVSEIRVEWDDINENRKKVRKDTIFEIRASTFVELKRKCHYLEKLYYSNSLFRNLFFWFAENDYIKQKIEEENQQELNKDKKCIIQ